MQPIVIEGQLTWQDYYAANLLHQRRPSQRWLILGVGVATTVLLAFQADGLAEFLGLVIFFFLVWAGLVVVLRMLLRVRSQRVYTQQVSLQLPFRLVIDGGTITCASERGNMMVKVHELVRWAEDKGLFLLYHSDVMFFVVPKRSFAAPADEERLRTLLLGAFPR